MLADAQVASQRHAAAVGVAAKLRVLEDAARARAEEDAVVAGLRGHRTGQQRPEGADRHARRLAHRSSPSSVVPLRSKPAAARELRRLRVGAAAPLAGGEARGAAGADHEHGRALARLDREALVERAPAAGEQRAAVREQRLLREAGEALGELERALEVAARRGTTSVTSPMASASRASTVRPVRTRSSARPCPTMRGSRWVPPSISGTPQRRSRQPNCAVSVAIRRSHQSATSSPPATHQPEIAAIVGFGEVRCVKPSGPPGSPIRGANESIALRSAPAQNAASPPPVTTSTRAPSSAQKRSKASRSSRRRSARRSRCGAPGGRS